jgi:L-fuconolactonase
VGTDGEVSTEVIDAHIHVACADGERYPRQPTGVGSDWWGERGEATELATTLDAAGVTKAVIVQAVGLYGYDCRCAVDAVVADVERFALVAALDFSAADPLIEFNQLADRAPLAGLRLFGVGATEPRWLNDGRGAAVWARATELGTVLVPTIFTEQFPALRALVGQYPDARVALDHCGFPDMGGPGAFDAVLALADLPSITLKVTSHNLDAVTEGEPAGFVDRLVAEFGADRLCWGSDYPQHQARTYAGMLDLARSATRHLDAAERAQFLGTTSLRLWWPPRSD